MVQLLKHTAFRLWTAVIGSGLFSLWVFSAIGAPASLTATLGVAGTLFLLLLWVSGWLSNHVGLALIHPLIDEAGVWERSGLPEEAGKRFTKALALLDSFLFSPRTRSRALTVLIGRMARFYLALPEAPQQAETFTRTYLNLHPEDEAFAAEWINRVEAAQELDAVPDAVLARIGDAHPSHPGIQDTLARHYLAEGRTDYFALQTYRRATTIQGGASREMIDRLTHLFLAEGRADEWALSIYLEAASLDAVPEAVLRGIAACQRWLVPTARNRSLLETASRHLAHLDEATRNRMTAGFVPPGFLEGDRPKARHRPVATDVLRQTGDRLDRFWETTAAALGRVLRSARRLPSLPGTLRILRWATISAFILGAIVLLINTADYLRPVPQPEPQTAAPPAVDEKPKPYTLQVAAYLKADYARKYVESLNARGQDAYIAETRGNGKTWYQVRVSRFEDKQTAIAFGENLKREGLIEEFYVANIDGFRRSERDASTAADGER